MNNKLNTLTLSGLIIGPILGSAIVLLPPLAYKLMGTQAMYPWILIMVLGAVFAYVFTQLSIMSPGNEGVSIAVGKGLGGYYRELASNFLTTAICFGPIAVMLTASEYIRQVFPFLNISDSVLALGLVMVSCIILTRGVPLMGKITLLLSTSIGLLLLVGGVYALFTTDVIYMPTGLPNVKDFGYTLLLLFWGIIGWEVLGNYVEDVAEPKKTLNKAMYISLVAITVIYMISAFAFQNVAMNQGLAGELTMSVVLYPLFGDASTILLGITASGLCICTYLMVVGGASRLTASRAENGTLPIILSKKNAVGAPTLTTLMMMAIHIILLTGAFIGIMSVENYIEMANACFISNAILGLAAGYVLFSNTWLKSVIVILLISFTIMLLFSNWMVLSMVGLIIGVTFIQYRYYERANRRTQAA